jgi:PST family polysaccharide transporter
MVDRKVATNAFLWSAVENGGLVVISFGCLIMFTRLLTPAEFGEFSVALSIVEIFTIVGSMLFHDALVQRPEVNDFHTNSAFVATLAISATMVLLIWLCADLIAVAAGQPALGPIVRWLSLSIPCAGIGTVLTAYQRRSFAFRSLALRSLVARGAGGAVAIGLAIFGAGLWSLVAQQVLMALLSATVLWAVSDKTPHLRFRTREFKELFFFGLPSVTTLFLRYATRRIFIVTSGMAVGPTEAGFINIAIRSVDMFWSVVSIAVSQVALPLLSRLQTDIVQLRRAFRKSVALASLILAPCFVGLAIVAPLLIELGFGARWLPSAPSAEILCVLYVLQAPQLFAIPLLMAIGRPRDTLLAAAAEMAAMLAMIGLIAMPTAQAAIYVLAAAQLFSGLVTAWLLRRASGISLLDQLAGAVIPLCASVVMGAFVWLVRTNLPVSWPTMAAVAAMVCAGGITFAGLITLLNRRLGREFVDVCLVTVQRRPRMG